MRYHREMTWFLPLLSACTGIPPVGDRDAADTASSTEDSGGELPEFFPAGSPWTAPIVDAPLDPRSADLIGALQDLGWGLGRMQIDFSFEVLEAAADTPRRPFQPTGDFFEPDCDEQPVPVPAEGNLEGEEGYRCTTDGDCHLIVVDRPSRQLFEMWRADIVGDSFDGGCLAVWDLDRTYPPEGRGDQCTSADAAGYPIAPLLFTADEVGAGEVPHALRFALPNSHIDNDVFHHPASHATGAGADGPIPYGARLRLRADFDRSRIESAGGQVLVTALQTYGMFLADGGNVALMGESDRRSAVAWKDVLEGGPHALRGIEPADFELVELGVEVPLTFDCVRNGF